MTENNEPKGKRKKKEPVYKRVSIPMKLTPRDVESVRLVADFRLMTREQIEKVLFKPEKGQNHPTKTSIAKRRLMLLYHNGYLDRVRTPLAFGSFASQPVYKVTAKGRLLLAHEDVPKGPDKDIGELFINHALAINDVRVAITLAAAASGDEVEQWKFDHQFKSQPKRETDYVTIQREKNGKKEQVPILPDSYFVLNISGKGKAHYLLEVDQGTMANTRFKTKVLAYIEYWHSRKYEARYKSRSFNVLTVTTSGARLANLKKITEEALKEKKRTELAASFWFTMFDQVTPESVLRSPIWLRAGDETAHHLI
jgi:hypothetical protein